MSRLLRRTVALLALALTAATCSGGDGTGSDSSSPTTGATTPAGVDEVHDGDDTESGTDDLGAAAGEPDSARASGSIPTPDAVACDTRPADGATTLEVVGGGVTAGVRVFVPPATPGDDGLLPAVLDWHGLGSDGGQQALLTGYDDLAAREGFVAVHPTGPRGLGGQRSWELAQLDVPDRDDIEFAGALIDRLVAEFCVDPGRVYSTGMSNGGFFTSRLVCELAGRIAAAVSVAGVTHPDDCEPSRPVPFLAFHGTADRIVPYAGGTSALALGPTTPEVEAFFDQVMPDEFAEFAADFGCDGVPVASTIGDEVTRFDYVECDGDVPLAFHEIEGGGHTWPGSALGPVLTGALGRTTTDVDATADGWEFMSRFDLDGERDA